MKKVIFTLLLLLFAFTSCEKEDLETSSLDTVKGTDSLTSFSLHSSKKSVTIIGEEDPAVDIAAVQDAVDKYDHIVLSGVFDFG